MIECVKFDHLTKIRNLNMKKSAVALGIIAVLGGAWAGVTWYSGKTAEQQFHAKINQINEKFTVK